MDRLTKIDGIGENELKRCFDCGSETAGSMNENCGICEHWQFALDELADYQSTDLTPDEIEAMKAELNRYRQAEADKRLVLLPDISDRCEMYLIYTGGTADALKTKIVVLDFDNRWTISHGYLSGHLYRDGFNASFTTNDIGKTVFFTREEAKQVLKERK